MTPLNTTAVAAIALSVLSACAQTPIGQVSAESGAVATVSDERMVMAPVKP